MTDDTIEQLKELQKGMLTQDHSWHITKDPLYMVYRKHVVVTTDDYSSDYTYYDHDNSEVIGKDKEALVKDIKEREIECPLDLEEATEDEIFEWLADYTGNITDKHYIEEVDVYEEVFFTEQAARDFIERKKHHNSTLHLYVASGYNNREVQLLQKLIMNIDLDSIRWKEK